MRLSKAFLKTYKEAPKEAEVVSHQLMLRASMIRQLTRGVYNYLPFGYRVLKKIENIVREEMDKAEAQEILMPVLQPASLWEESGRWFAYGPELMRLKDRSEREFALGPTHEEVVTDIVRNTIDSYKNLPVNLYQIQTKFRDEMRPRFGLMRGREFVMKDAYSFHLTDESLDQEYQNMKNTYCRILERCGLVFRAVEADTGSIGGSESHEFMVLAESGEDDILYSNKSDYAANVEKATSIIDFKESNEEKLEKVLVDTPNVKSIEELSQFLNIEECKTVKAVLLKEIGEEKINYFMAIIRGDLDVNDVKVKNLVGAILDLEMMDEKDIENLGLEAGFTSALKEIESIKDGRIKVVADESIFYLRNFVGGANIKDKHYVNLNIEDLHIDYRADIRTARVGDKSPRDEGTLEIARGIEVGHIFKLGKKYSDALNAKVLNDKGVAETVIMGCYGIGVSRVAAAAIEQNYDENGIIWPKNIAPFLVDLILVNSKDEDANKLSEKLYKEMLDSNIEVIFDDRDEKAGFKFKDADLIGFPLKVIVGKAAKDGKVEIKHRDGSQSFEIEAEKVVEYIKEYMGE